MAKSKQTKSKKAKSAVPYIQRLLEDEYVQEQLRNAADGLRSAYDRVKKRPAEAPEDKRLYAHARHAATSIRRAATALQRPKPTPKRHVPKRTAAAAAIGGGALVATTRARRKQQSRTTTSAVPSTPTAEGSSVASAGAQHPGEASSTATSSTT